MALMDVDHILQRYIRCKILIEKLDLEIDIENQKSASVAENWIGPLATKTCLKEFSLTVPHPGHDSTFTLPDELLMGEKLTKIRLQSWRPSLGYWYPLLMTTSHHPVIKCVSLQELYLHRVRIGEEALNDILSSCTLLVKIELIKLESESSEGFKTIKVKNLLCLYKLLIELNTWSSPALEISDVPNLRIFTYDINNNDLDGWRRSQVTEQPISFPFNAKAHSMSLSNVTELMLGGELPDYTCLDMIQAWIPFLENLTLDLTSWKLGSFHITCPSIKILSLRLLGLEYKKLSAIQVHAPKLLSFSFSGHNMPHLLFPVSSLRKIKLTLFLNLPVDASFFLNTSEALTLSPKCDMFIRTFRMSSDMPLDIDIDDLRRRLVFPPTTNVQQLNFGTFRDECEWERSLFFDAFFEICHPKYVIARPDMSFRHANHFCRLMLKEVLEKKNSTGFWPDHLKHVLTRSHPHTKWEPLTNSHRSFLHGSDPDEFKLEWRS